MPTGTSARGTASRRSSAAASARRCNTIKGFTDVNTVTNGVAYGADHSKWSLAWQLTAGLAYQVTPNLTLEAAYRYIDLGNAASGDLVDLSIGTNTVNNPMEFRHLISHDFKVGLRYSFGVPQITATARPSSSTDPPPPGRYRRHRPPSWRAVSFLFFVRRFGLSRRRERISRGGTPLPNEGLLSERVD